MIVTSMSANDDKPDPPAHRTPAERHEVRIGVEDFEHFIQRAVRGMAAIVGELGNDGAGRRPFGPRSNSAYGLLTHCLGVIDYWGGALIAGRSIDRDRAAEFHAVGAVEPLVERAERALAQLTLDIATMESGRPLRVEPDPSALGPDRPLDQAGALLHLFEEMAQHHGQMQGLRDALLATEEPGPTRRA